jgi:hypothetical protein
MFQIRKKIKNQKFHNSQKIPLGYIYNMMCQSQRAAAPPHPYSTFGQTTIFRTIQDYLFSFSQARWKHETGIVKGLELANSKQTTWTDHHRSIKSIKIRCVKKRSKLANSKPPEPIIMSDQSRLNVRLRNDFFAKFQHIELNC